MKSTFYKILKRMTLIIFISIGVLIITTIVYMKQSKFGKTASKDQIAELNKLSNFENGKFQNIEFTPELTEGYSTLGIAYDFLFKKQPRKVPIDTIPSIKTNLSDLNIEDNVLIWFGHSSYFMQIDGKRILVDPVFSGNASPIPGSVKSFIGTDVYTASDLPQIDYLFISHDHYDHVDYSTLINLKEKVNKVICGLGVGAHFKHWGYTQDQIIETNWGQEVSLDSNFTSFSTPARHFSGRGFTRNKTLWLSYVLKTPSLKIYLGGDSGYGSHFAEIGKKHGPIDLAILENGQYDAAWEAIHMHPNEVLIATQDLKAKRLFPVHSSKFTLGNHPWDEPLKKVTALNKDHNIPLVTPIIGEIVYLNDTTQTFKQWWKDLE
jgi:L-ascorbate metabolism protein UlaG (beta-lactamase superfamily)